MAFGACANFVSLPFAEYKGFQVAPSELEGILNSHPLVEESAVCAKWDDREGTEVPMAYVTLTKLTRTHYAESSDPVIDIARFVNERVSSYKKLRGGVEILDDLPKTASGKILRRLLPVRIARARPAKL